jgi:hypothetical protein
MVGDIAMFPYTQQDNKPVRIEHWDVAINHGRSVANHIVKGGVHEGNTLPPKPPFYHTDDRLHIHGVFLVCAGHTDEILGDYCHRRLR